MSLSADGNTLAVGAYGEDNDSANAKNQSASRSGAAYVFVRDGTEWSRSAYLKTSNISVDDQFGASVSISADGNTLAVDAYGESSDARTINVPVNERNNGANFSGAVYIFTSSDSNEWHEQAYIKVSNARLDNYFGWSVSLSKDGNTLAVGAYAEKGNVSGIHTEASTNEVSPNSGAVFTFTRSAGAWSQQSYLKASNALGEALFGSSVAISSDGDTLVVGALREAGDVSGINVDESNGSSSRPSYNPRKSRPTAKEIINLSRYF